MTSTESEICVAALYRFVRLPNHGSFREPLLAQMRALNIYGTVLLAEEGINGTVAGLENDVDSLIEWLKQDTSWQGRLAATDVKKSYTAKMPFARQKVKLKKEIVTLGVQGVDPNKVVGTYVEPRDWNALISDPETIVIDTRNDYEVQVGTFRDAINPGTETFREFPAFAEQSLDPAQHKKVAMFCTGGIRCEKSTAWMKEQGFEEVYHLKGGILKYLEEVPEDESLWEGECFVFDERVTVNHKLQPGTYVQCHACRMPLDETALNSELYIAGEQCPYCHDKTSAEQRERFREREKQMRLAQARGDAHIGANAVMTSEARRAAKLNDKKTQQLAGSSKR